MKNLFPLINDTDFLFPDTIFNNLTPSRGFAQPTGTTIPDVDIEDTGTMYVLKADLPGIVKEDINMTYDDDDVLTISARHEETQEENDKKYICRERANKCFCRQFVVHNIDGNAIQASLTDGVLEVKLPKQDKQQIEKNHRIEIK